MDIIQGILNEALLLLNKMSVYLLMGFLFAGIMHVFLKEGTIAKHLGKNNLSSVFKASLLGIPLPLCSCAVVPAALSLKKEGASKGPVLSFLISTPTTSFDSLFVTFSLLGGVFAIFRIVASFMIAATVGILHNILIKQDFIPQSSETSECKSCCSGVHKEHGVALKDKVRAVFTYAFVDLIRDSGAWILGGILAGAVISYFVPSEFISKYMGSPWISMMIMLLVGIPMYVCSAGSVPIAAALMFKGLNPGAAFVFLMTGPATNTAALTILVKEMGFKSMVLLLATVSIGSLILGGVLNLIWGIWNVSIVEKFMEHNTVIPSFWQGASSSILLLVILLNLFLKKKSKHSH